MIYCLNCGKGIPDQSKFCTFCGTPIAQIDRQNPNAATPSTTQPVTPVPTEQQYVEPTPTSQQYVNPIPPQQQYVNPNYQTNQQQQYVNPNYQTNQQQQFVNPSPAQQFVRVQPVTTKNEFYKNIGFWGAVLVFVGFFLPYVSNIDASFYYLVSEFGADKPDVYLYLIFPISSLIIIIQGLTGILPRFVVVIFKLLPLLLLALLIVGGSQSGSGFSFLGNDAATIMKTIGVGLYMTAIGSILMLFFRTTKIKA